MNGQKKGKIERVLDTIGEEICITYSLQGA